MTTVRDICTRALRKAGVVAHGEDAEAENASAALDDLNMMLAAWKLAGVDTSHTALELSDTFPLAGEYEEGTVFMLAGRMQPDFQFPPTFDADDFFRKIQAAYMEIEEATIPLALRRTPSRYWPHPRIR